MVVDVHESIAVNRVVSHPADCEVRFGFLKVDRFGVAAPRDTGGEMIGRVQPPGALTHSLS